MTKLTDMKLPKPKKNNLKTAAVPYDMNREQYPYGLRLSLGNDEVEKLPGLKKLDIDEEVSINARARVVSVNLDKSQDTKGDSKERFRIAIQIEQIAISKVNDGQDSFDEAVNKKD